MSHHALTLTQVRFYGYDVDSGFLLNVLTDTMGMDTFDFYPATGACTHLM